MDGTPTIYSMERKIINAVGLLLYGSSVWAQAVAPNDSVRNEAAAQHIRSMYTDALTHQTGYRLLQSLCAEVGPRPVCSTGDAKAIAWAVAQLEKMDFDSVYVQPVPENPHWVRGVETATALGFGKAGALNVTALGGSVGTPGGNRGKGITAQVVEVKSFAELDRLAAAGGVSGKIVFFNRPMDPSFIHTGSAYGNAGDQRWAGAQEASKHGAVAVLVRSLTLRTDDYPHTGGMSYGDAPVKIPAAGISTVDANWLSEQLKNRPELEVRLVLGCESRGTCFSYNVVGEWRGTGRPEEIAVVGGHLDSWDLATGAQDDGAGCAQSIQALGLMMRSGYKPQRTHRVVLFANEEFGLNGARTYAEKAQQRGEKHVLAMESDGGSGTPRGFSTENQAARAQIERFQSLLAPYGLLSYSVGGSGADIGALRGQNNVVLVGLSADSQRYFDYHHSAQDVIETIHPRELELGAAAMASLLYLFDSFPQ